MSNSFNPSLGAKMKQFPKTNFGLVVSMPFLPAPGAEFHSRPVFNQKDGCIYYSKLVDGAYVWEKTTNGVFRQYIFSTLPVVAEQPVITYVETEDTAPQPGTHYYTKNNLNRFVNFTGTEFERGKQYYVMSATVHSYTFNDVVAAMNSLLIEFKRWGVTFVNAPESGQLEDATYRDVVILLNEMIVHVNTYSNRQLVPYSGEGYIPVINIPETVMRELVDHLNNLISAVNPYVDVLTDIQRALSGLIAASSAPDWSRATAISSSEFGTQANPYVVGENGFIAYSLRNGWASGAAETVKLFVNGVTVYSCPTQNPDNISPLIPVSIGDSVYVTGMSSGSTGLFIPRKTSL